MKLKEKKHLSVGNEEKKRSRPKFVKSGGKGRPRKIYCMANDTKMLNSVIENPKTS